MVQPLQLRDAERDLLYAFIEAEFGIDPRARRRGTQQAWLEKLWKRVCSLGLSSFTAYVHHLKHDDPGHDEVRRAASLIANNETYFFRERAQLAIFQNEILAHIKRRKQIADDHTITMYSVGCSSGEEVYTLAILVLSSRLFLPTWDIRIVGLDISESALQTARAGIYQHSAFRAIDPVSLTPYLRARDGGAYAVKPWVRSLTSFRYANLTKPDLTAQLQDADVIWCRNVLIYFSQKRCCQVVTSLYNALQPGGILLLGHAESLAGIFSKFSLVRFPGAVAYVKDPR